MCLCVSAVMLLMCVCECCDVVGVFVCETAMCGRESTHVTVCVWRPEDSLTGLVISFDFCVDPEDETQVIRQEQSVLFLTELCRCPSLLSQAASHRSWIRLAAADHQVLLSECVF